jgi:hypothetical protein
MLRFQKKSLFNFIFFFITFFYSYFLFYPKFYFPADQIFYYKIYETIKNLEFFEAFNLYQSLFASEEIFHFIYIYFFSNLGLTKEFAMSLANAIFIYLILKFTHKYMKLSFISFFLILTNHYLFNLFFELERLKFAIIFFLVFVNYFNIRFVRIISFFLSILSHFSIIFLYFAIYIINEKKNKIFNIKYKNISSEIIIIIFLGSAFLYIFDTHIMIKLSQFSLDLKTSNYLNFFKPFIFYLLICYVRDYKINKNIFLAYLFLSILCLLHEHSRFVLFSFLIFYYQLLQSSNKNKIYIIFYLFFIYSCLQTIYKLSSNYIEYYNII